MTVAAETGITQMALVASQAERTVGCAITSRTSTPTQGRFKDWMALFKGVASKYPPSYLGWRRMIERDRDRLTPRHCLPSIIG